MPKQQEPVSFSMMTLELGAWPAPSKKRRLQTDRLADAEQHEWRHMGGGEQEVYGRSNIHSDRPGRSRRPP